MIYRQKKKKMLIFSKSLQTEVNNVMNYHSSVSQKCAEYDKHMENPTTSTCTQREHTFAFLYLTKYAPETVHIA